MFVCREIREALRLRVQIEALDADPWRTHVSSTKIRLREDVEAEGERHRIRLGEEVPVLVSAMAIHLDLGECRRATGK